MLSIIVFLTILSVLILVHEVGHFLAARKAGVRVEEFALGLPFTRRLWGRKIGSVVVSLYPILFGGFVRMTGEDAPQIRTTDPENFQNKRLPARFLIIVAGVGMNILLGAILFTVVLGVRHWQADLLYFRQFSFLGAEQSVVPVAVIVSEVISGMPAERAGIMAGDVITHIDGEAIAAIEELQNSIHARVDTETVVKVQGEENRATRIVSVTPVLDAAEGRGMIGVKVGQIQQYHLDYSGFPAVLVSGVSHAMNVVGYQVAIFSSLLQYSIETGDGEIVKQGVSGPVGIGFLVHTLVTTTNADLFIELLSLTAIVSVSLGVINLLPLPALDGGRIPFLLVEALTGRRIPRVERVTHQVGMALLLVLVVVITVNDIQRFVDISSLVDRWFHLQ